MDRYSLLIFLLAALTSGCTDTIFGCADREIGVSVSPDNTYKAVTRECGCKAQNGTYLVAAIVARDADESCSTLETHAFSTVVTKTSGGANDATGDISVQWKGNRDPVVRLNKAQRYRLSPLEAPMITVVNDL